MYCNVLYICILTIIVPISDLSDDKLVNILLFGDDIYIYSAEQNSSVLQNKIIFLKSSESFDIFYVLFFTFRLFTLFLSLLSFI